MRRLTLKDKRTLRSMLADACAWQEHNNTSYIEAAKMCDQYGKTLAKIVPYGPIRSERRNTRSPSEAA